MAISKDKKTTLVADLTELLKDSKMVVYAKYEGLTVAELQELRKLARESGIKIKVVKNRLVKVAMKEIAAYKDTDNSTLVGQLLYAVGADEDFDAAKVLTKFAKTHAKMELVGGFNGDGANLSKIGHCCREWRYRFTQFKAVYELHKATWAARGEADAEPPAMDEVQARDMERYREAYRRRCELA